MGTLHDPNGSPSSARVALLVWTFVPIALWVWFSLRHDAWIPLSDMSGLDLIIMGLSSAIGMQHWAKRKTTENGDER